MAGAPVNHVAAACRSSFAPWEIPQAVVQPVLETRNFELEMPNHFSLFTFPFLLCFFNFYLFLKKMYTITSCLAFGGVLRGSYAL
jgi:hypothetical protein